VSDTGNKGEWSEFYALLKLITDKKVYSADEDLRTLSNYYPVLKVTADKGSKYEVGYNLQKDDIIEVLSPNGDIIKSLQVDSLKSHVQEIFDQIISNKASFRIELAEKLQDELCKPSLRAHSVKKADIFVVLHDIVTQINREIGFSIKSQAGSPATLLNASGATNFIYSVQVNDPSKQLVDTLNAPSNIKNRIGLLERLGGSLVFDSMDNQTFCTNLRIIEGLMPEIISSMLVKYYKDGISSLVDLVNAIESDNPLDTRGFVPDAKMYSIKIKNLLTEVALGMTPSKPWDGSSEANGGYLIIKSNGELVCYHIYDRDIFKEYLVRHTKLEAPSKTRHKFGEFYLENGLIKLKLNLQIRFK